MPAPMTATGSFAEAGFGPMVPDETGGTAACAEGTAASGVAIESERGHERRDTNPAFFSHRHGGGSALLLFGSLIHLISWREPARTLCIQKLYRI